MQLTKDEKIMIKFLLEKHIKKFKNDEHIVLWEGPRLLAAEVKNEEFLKNLLKKFK